MDHDAVVYNYLMLSDVHLGSDLVQHAAPWTLQRLARERDVDRQLASLLAFYRQTTFAQRPWKLILAGDFIDLVGMSVTPFLRDGPGTEPSHEELRHGLGNASDQSAEKMRLVVERHRAVFAALGAFVRDGHSLVFVRGNHDVEFFWESVQEAFVQALIEHQGRPLSDSEQQRIRARVEFQEWFYYAPGVAYVEHGHQYDETCAYHHQLAPLCPTGRTRLSYSFSDILLRYIVRPTRGLSSDGHENRTLMDYMGLCRALGLRGASALAVRFVRALLRMVAAWRAHTGEGGKPASREQARRLHRLAQATRIDAARLSALDALSAKPVTSDIGAIVRSVFLDGLLALGGVGLLLLGLVLFGSIPAYAAAAVGAMAAVPAVTWLRRSRVVDPDEALRDRAEDVAELMPARYVVMGHTHLPRFDRLQRTTYVNLGWWAGDESEAPVGEAPRSYLLLRWNGRGYDGGLFGWDADLGARRLLPGPVAPDSERPIESPVRSPGGSGLAGSRPIGVS